MEPFGHQWWFDEDLEEDLFKYYIVSYLTELGFKCKSKKNAKKMIFKRKKLTATVEGPGDIEEIELNK